MSETVISQMSELFGVFSNPNRLKILLAIKEAGEMNVSQLEASVSLSQSAISHQLASMRESRILKVEIAGKQRIYRFADKHIEELLEIVIQHMSEA
ncbi:ArsR/SmtB family transcription factor [Lactococcus termiticola]|uniref:ArsR family transcriptional regulator n=1 Tax=Lactococcus termiticola TaxID=2169526 RepID=A0A2R5HF60_9LACT|nr:metalloregulator ArsR/SmtB family transcription factor [Lactococcus termiticola]GBG96697.1 ArsR family transcriptional regulator [Lactococcus termiticola]